MKQIKSLLLGATIGLSLLTANAQDAKFYPLGNFTGGTNNVLATATNSPGTTINVSEYDTVGVQITAKPSGSSTGNLDFKFADSLNTSDYDSTPRVCRLTFNGTGAITEEFDLSIPNTASFKLTGIENTNAVYGTNIAIGFRFKAPNRKNR